MQTFSVRRVVSVVDRTWENIYPTFSSSLGSTLLLIEKATHDPLYLWDIRTPPRSLASSPILIYASISPCKNTQKNNSSVHQRCPIGNMESRTKCQEQEIDGVGLDLGSVATSHISSRMEPTHWGRSMSLVVSVGDLPVRSSSGKQTTTASVLLLKAQHSRNTPWRPPLPGTSTATVISQHVGQLRGRIEGFCILHLKLWDFSRFCY
jgi:hypothetical protein